MTEQIFDHGSTIEFEYAGRLVGEAVRGRKALSEKQLAQLEEYRTILLSFVDVTEMECSTEQRCDWVARIVDEGFRVAIWAPQTAWFGVWRQALLLAGVSTACGMAFYDRVDALDWLAGNIPQPR